MALRRSPISPSRSRRSSRSRPSRSTRRHRIPHPRASAQPALASPGRWCSWSRSRSPSSSSSRDSSRAAGRRAGISPASAALFADRLVLTSLVRRWARSGRLVRRVIIVGGGREGETLVRALEHEADSDLRICGVFDDRAGDRSPDGRRRHSQARHGRRPRRVHPPHPRRPDPGVAAAHRRGARAAHGAQAVGAAGRRAARRAHEPAALPPARLFLYRQRPGPRHLRQADRRLEHGDQVGVRPRRRQPDLPRHAAGHGRRPRSPSSSTARDRSCSASAATASTTR